MSHVKISTAMITILRIVGIRDDNYIKVAFNKPGRLDFIMEGNTEVLNFLKLDQNRFKVVNTLLPFVVPDRELIEGFRLKYEGIDVIFNDICEPDVCMNALRSASYYLRDNVDVPVINHPHYVMEISRDRVSEKLQGIKGLYVPKIIRIKPDSVESIKKVVEKQNMYPFIFREIGRHTYTEAVLVKNRKDLELLEVFSFRGNEYYIVEFVDYKSEDGLYRKYRVAVIDGKLYPRSLMISDYWNVHGESRARVMDKDERYRIEDKNWLNGFKGKAYSPLLEIYKRLNLDLFIIDFGILKDGSIVLFEVSPCFRLVSSTDFKKEYSYFAPHVERIQKAIINMIEKRANMRKKQLKYL